MTNPQQPAIDAIKGRGERIKKSEDHFNMKCVDDMVSGKAASQPSPGAERAGNDMLHQIRFSLQSGVSRVRIAISDDETRDYVRSHLTPEELEFVDLG